MAAKLMGLVFELDLGRDEFPVMIALADHARDDGSSVYPSVAYLAWKVNLSERSVQRILRKLEDRGLIEVVGNEHGGRGRTREYVLHLDRAPRKPPFRHGERVTERHPNKEEKGDTESPIAASKGVSVAPIRNQKGDTCDAKRVTPVTLKGDTGVTQTLREPSVEPSEVTANAETPPNAHYVLFQICCELNGGSAESNPDPKKQLRVFSRMLKKYGFRRVEGCMRWMAQDDFWRMAGFDAFNVENRMDKYLMMGEPDAPREFSHNRRPARGTGTLAAAQQLVQRYEQSGHAGDGPLAIDRGPF